MRSELTDPRAWQIAALGILLAWNVTQLSMGAALLPSLVAIVATVGCQTLWARVSSLPHRDLRSPLITGLSLALLLRGDGLLVPAAAGMLAVASKCLVRVNGKHLFNPAAFAILALILSGHGWVSPGQWGQTALLVGAMVFLAILVLSRAGRLDTALAFLAAHAGLLAARALWLGDPIAIPLHQLQNGALLLFAFFMITDPKTTPDARVARMLFAVAVAGLAHWLAFSWQMRPALYVALVATSVTVPILDLICPAEQFTWRQSKEAKP